MVGLLKIVRDRFCVEYADRRVQVLWRPDAPEAIAKAERWFAEALPRQQKIPETMLPLLIGCNAKFASGTIRKDREVEQPGALSDGGTIKLVYFQRDPLSDDDYREAVETLATWLSSYFR